MSGHPRKWVFLGDSLVEGIGRSRMSLVTELVKGLRDSKRPGGENPGRVGYVRMKAVDPETFDRFVSFNFAGEQDVPGILSEGDLLVLNLAAEATSVRSDMAWLPFLQLLKPDRVVLMRGSLESILRPACALDGGWPWWLPRSWRGPVAMDPRCYFSSSWWRALKQKAVDDMKQRARFRLLARFGSKPLDEPQTVVADYRELAGALRRIGGEIVVVGLLPVSDRTFPGSRAHFEALNARLRELARELGVRYMDWNEMLPGVIELERHFFRDGFHPNAQGAALFGKTLGDHLGR